VARAYARGERYRTPTLLAHLRAALDELPVIAREIREYPVKPPVGQWNWLDDAEMAMQYYEQITRTGWPAETHGAANPYAGLTFRSQAR
jgi:hypothetical protein